MSPRLIACQDCGTAEVLPDVLGDSGELDPLLARVLNNHIGPLSTEQQDRRIRFGLGRGREIDPKEMHKGPLFEVAADDWANPDVREKILKQIWGDTGYPAEFYAATDTYKEDALRCFRRHDSPGSEKGPHACIDYQADSKRLTDEQWIRRGQGTRDHIYLCTFCPYESVVTTRKRSARGDYDK